MNEVPIRLASVPWRKRLAALSDKGASDSGVAGTKGTRTKKNIIAVVREVGGRRKKGGGQEMEMGYS